MSIRIHLVVASFVALVVSFGARAEVPVAADLIDRSWCYATDGGEKVETWTFADGGKVEIKTYVERGSKVRHTSKGATWRLTKKSLILRAPPAARRVLAIETRQGTRLIFKDGTQALVCQIR